MDSRPKRGARERSERPVGNLSPGELPGRTLVLTSRQRIRRLDLRLLQRIAQALLDQLWPVGGLDVAIHVVGAPEITRLNEAFLRRKGSTDVITFDYSERAGQASRLPAPKSTDSGGLDRQDAC